MERGYAEEKPMTSVIRRYPCVGGRETKRLMQPSDRSRKGKECDVECDDGGWERKQSQDCARWIRCERKIWFRFSLGKLRARIEAGGSVGQWMDVRLNVQR